MDKTLPQTTIYRQLLFFASQLNNYPIKSLFQLEATRFPNMTVSTGGLILDYSKNQITEEILRLLLRLAEERNVPAVRDAMFSGDKINISENRAVLHTALRSSRTESILVDGEDVVPEIRSVLKRMQSLTLKIHAGEWQGFTGKCIKDVINIGIGGSDLGPRMVVTALRHYRLPRVSVHFVSNVDGHDLESVLNKVNPETTLFIISSKSFTTKETVLNAQSVRRWFLDAGAEVSDIKKHFVAVTANVDVAESFGIPAENIYPIWDWVGGRYSVWSAIGLPVMLAVGVNHFMELLSGAHAMDVHFKYAPLDHNMPVLLALIGIWNRNFLGYHTLAVAPYHEDLFVFSRWLQQLEMESNGKSVQKDGEPVSYGTAPIILGNTGTNGQHSYFQLFHQGTDICPVDFIAVLKPTHSFDKHHEQLLANCFAQAEALMRGADPQKAKEYMLAKGIPAERVESLLKQTQFEGNRPSNMIVMNELRPETLGALMALYEHKVFVQGVIWNINSFDQWGVELGKALATNIHKELTGEAVYEHDSSTTGLIELAKAGL
ncbi:MAG: glucose-6-phosphate isomerase [Oxalobacter sp.]|nr:glucose-6-phosphate isomerase [Oxalobacter sp.]